LRIVCGSHHSFIPQGAWLKSNAPFSFCQLKVSPGYNISPNIGSTELAEAFSRVIPFIAMDEHRQVLRCIKVLLKDNKLSFIATDGFTLSQLNLDFEAGEYEALVSGDDIKPLISALRKARRVRLGIEEKPDGDNGGLISKSLIIDTELVKYTLPSQNGTYPDYEKVFPDEFNVSASFDTREAVKACHSLLSIWFNDNTKELFRPLILTVADNRLIIEAKEDRGQAVIPAETNGTLTVCVAGSYLLKALKACGGIVEMKLAGQQSPVTLCVDGYTCLIMPMAIPHGSKEQQTATADVPQESEQPATINEPFETEQSASEVTDEVLKQNDNDIANEVTEKIETTATTDVPQPDKKRKSRRKKRQPVSVV
jgi:DNA polymerase-3 subunit beta